MVRLVDGDETARTRQGRCKTVELRPFEGVLLAAYDVLLSRWSGQDDVVVGTIVANIAMGVEITRALARAVLVGPCARTSSVTNQFVHLVIA